MDQAVCVLRNKATRNGQRSSLWAAGRISRAVQPLVLQHLSCSGTLFRHKVQHRPQEPGQRTGLCTNNESMLIDCH